MRRRKGSDPKKLRGAQRMLEFGYKKSDVWLDQAEKLVLLSAARSAGMGLAKFIRLAALDWCATFVHPTNPWCPPVGLAGTPRPAPSPPEYYDKPGEPSRKRRRN